MSRVMGTTSNNSSGVYVLSLWQPPLITFIALQHFNIRRRLHDDNLTSKDIFKRFGLASHLSIIPHPLRIHLNRQPPRLHQIIQMRTRLACGKNQSTLRHRIPE